MDRALDIMDWKIREERRESPRHVHDEVQEIEGCDGGRFCERRRRGLLKERVSSIDKGDWTSPKLGLKRTEPWVKTILLRGKVWFDFYVSGERVNFESEDMKRVTLGEEQCWSHLFEGKPQFQRRKENKVGQKSRWSFCKNKERTCKRKANADIFMWSKRRKKHVVKYVECSP